MRRALSRRRFIEVGVATSVAGAALGVTQDVFAASTGSSFASGSWLALQGSKIGLLDQSGTVRRVRVAAVTVDPAQAGMTGESFRVLLTGANGRLPDAVYRLRSGLSGQVFLVEGAPGSAVLTVNTVRPTG